MTQCNTSNVKLSNSELNKLKFAIKNSTEVTLKISSKVVGDSLNMLTWANSLMAWSITRSNIFCILK